MTNLESQIIGIYFGVELLKVRIGGNDSVLQHKYGLDHTRKAARPFKMADVWFYGTSIGDYQYSQVACAFIWLTMDLHVDRIIESPILLERAPNGLGLSGITNGGSGPMGLKVPCVG
jgi:hypothetical protein